MHQPTQEETALITFTTGSTGTPKAAKRTHGFLREQFNALLEKIDPQPTDIDMPVLPIVLLCNLGVGATSVIANFKASKPDTLQPEKVLEQLQQYQVNRITASPFFIRKLAEHINKTNTDVSQIEKVFTGGAPVFPQEAIIYNAAFPTTSIEIVYGSTEAEPISSISAKALINEKENVVKNGLKVGTIYHKAEVKVIRITEETITCETEQELEKWEVAPGQYGEIIVAGKHVLKEYYNNPEALKRNKIFTDSNVWHRTGDGGYRQADTLFLTGRCAQLVPDGDGYISPFITENFLQEVAGVSLGTILKHKDQLWLVIELNSNGKREDVLTAVKSSPLKYNEIHFITKIPRDPRHNSKIDYDQLQQMIEREAVT